MPKISPPAVKVLVKDWSVSLDYLSLAVFAPRHEPNKSILSSCGKVADFLADLKGRGRLR